jgi:hypothetical protein
MMSVEDGMKVSFFTSTFGIYHSALDIPRSLPLSSGNGLWFAFTFKFNPTKFNA